MVISKINSQVTRYYK